MKKFIIFLFFFFCYNISYWYTTPEKLGTYWSNGIKINANNTWIHVNWNDSYLTNIQYQTSNDVFYNTAAWTFFQDKSSSSLWWIPANCNASNCATQYGIYQDFANYWSTTNLKFKQDSNFLYFYIIDRDRCYKQSLSSTSLNFIEAWTACTNLTTSYPTYWSYVNFITFDGFNFDKFDFSGAYLTSKNWYYHINDRNTWFSLLKNPWAKLHYDRSSDDYYLTFGNNSNNCYLIDFTNSNNTPYSFYTAFSSTCKSSSLEMIDSYFYYQRSSDLSIIDKISKNPFSSSSVLVDLSYTPNKIFQMNHKLYNNGGWFWFWDSNFNYINIENWTSLLIWYNYSWVNIYAYYMNLWYTSYNIEQYNKNQVGIYSAFNPWFCWNSDIGTYSLPFKAISTRDSWCNASHTLYDNLTSSWFSVLWVTYNQYIPPINITSLKQYVQSPWLNREEIGVWTNLWAKIWKYQSWSWIILSADLQNDTWDKVRLVVDVYRFWNNIQVWTYYNSGSYLNMTLGTLDVDLPYLWVWEYYWKARIETIKWVTNNWVDYKKNNVWEYDFALFEGFEPYLYGYKFPNSHPAKWVLDGSLLNIDLSFFSSRIKIYWNKWEIFNSVFPESMFSSDTKMYDAFESYWLNQENPSIFSNWSCVWLSLTALQFQRNKILVESDLNDFYNLIGPTWTIWENANMSIDWNWLWNKYDVLLKTILEFQLFQKRASFQNALNKSQVEFTNPIDVLNELKENPNKPYILWFWWRKDEFSNIQRHIVVPYKVEWNKIYIWDNNVPFPNTEINEEKQLAYQQYIEIGPDWKSWTSNYYHNFLWWRLFDEIEIMGLNDIVDGTSNPMWFNDNDTLYSLSWASDLYVLDSLWRVSWFQDGRVLQEIPWVNVIIPLGLTLSGSLEENTWKQIYLPQRQDLTVKIVAGTEESYDLMIAWGNYYTKIDNVETSSGQIDTFIQTRENIKIDFDDSKVWAYNLLVDNFYNSGTWTVYIDSVQSTVDAQQYTIDWTKVVNNENTAVTYQIDSDKDDNYETTTSIPPIFQDLLAPTTTHSFSGTSTQNTVDSYIETVSINLSATDNEWGSGIDTTYYALWTDMWTLFYQPYTEAIIVNWVWNYTLHYYAIDKFWNTEWIKTVNFALTEKPETYAWNISWYVYEDTNSNWIKETTEKTMTWWKVCIDLNSNNNCEENVEPFNLTNNNGYYEFDSLITWTYHILEIPHQNWVVTNPTDWKHTINLQNGQVITEKNFWNIKIKGWK